MSTRHTASTFTKKSTLSMVSLMKGGIACLHGSRMNLRSVAFCFKRERIGAGLSYTDPRKMLADAARPSAHHPLARCQRIAPARDAASKPRRGLPNLTVSRGDAMLVVRVLLVVHQRLQALQAS